MRAISGQNGLAVGVVSTSDVGKTQASIDNNTTGNPISISHVNSYTNPAQNISSGITVNSVTSNMAKSVSSGINVVRSDVLNTGKSISNGISTAIQQFIKRSRKRYRGNYKHSNRSSNRTESYRSVC